MNEDLKIIIEGLTPEQQLVVNKAMETNAIAHSGLNDEHISTIFKNAKRDGSLKDAFLEHAGTYGINNIEMLFPEATAKGAPTIINNQVEWVSKVLNATTKQPFARVKVMFADISVDTAKARGYVTTERKVESVFGLLKRTTDPTTIYKKEKIDRDDAVDITDFDVVAWIKSLMRQKVDEELAKAVLFGDGRLNSDPYKIDETCIRPVCNDDDFYSVKVAIDTEATDKAKEFINTCIRSRKLYRGSGMPALYTTEDLICDMLLIEDTTGRRIYKTIDEIKAILRVSDIIPIEAMVGLKRKAADDATKDHNVMAIITNLADYSIGTNKGGQVSVFDDFDIDYNQQKYLMETRCSGALTVPYSALVIEDVTPKAAGFSMEEGSEDLDQEDLDNEQA